LASPSVVAERAPVGSGASPSVAAKPTADDEPLDEIVINTELATLEVRAFVEEQRGDRHAASELRQRMALLRSKLGPRDSAIEPDRLR
jgi:hypothetical protein